MQLSIVSLFLAAAVPLVNSQPISDRADTLPGLSKVQSAHATKIIGVAEKGKLGRHGCEAGIATALVEVSKPLFCLT